MQCFTQMLAIITQTQHNVLHTLRNISHSWQQNHDATTEKKIVALLTHATLKAYIKSPTALLSIEFSKNLMHLCTV